MQTTSKVHYSGPDIQNLPKLYRINLINSISGYKPANLIATIGKGGATNLAINSSVVHLGSSPALLGFILRPVTVPRHTLQNIRETLHYTINHVHLGFMDKAHYTSAKFSKEESEFDHTGLIPEYIDSFPAPYVRESEIKIGLKKVDEVEISINNTTMIIGQIEHIYLPLETIDQDGNVNLNLVEDVCVSGLNTYHSVTKVSHYPYARPGEFPVNI